MFNRQIAALPVALALLLAACTPAPKGSAATQSASGAEQPQAGGTLTFIVNAEPPSFDGHRETTFALLHPIAPHYSTLLRVDPTTNKVIATIAGNTSLHAVDVTTGVVRTIAGARKVIAESMHAAIVAAFHGHDLTPASP